jgi:hypothetical protein
LNRKVICEPVIEDISLDGEKQVYNSVKKKDLKCTCNKYFSSRQGLHYHKQRCLHKQVKEVNVVHSITNPRSRITQLENKNKALRDAIQTSPNINVRTNTVTNINFFGKEDITHLPMELLTSCFMKKDILTLVESIYFDKDLPHNNTVKLKSLKNKTALVHNEGTWVIKRLQYVLDEMVNKGLTILEDHYNHNMNGMNSNDIEGVLAWLQKNRELNAKVRYAIRQDILILLQRYRDSV